MDKLGSSESAEDHLPKVMAAFHEAAQSITGQGGADASKVDNPAFNEALLGAINPILGMVAAFSGGMSSEKDPRTGLEKRPQSIFLSGGFQPQIRRITPVSMMPVTRSSGKNLLGKDILGERVSLTHQSLTGHSPLSPGKDTPIKGLRITPAMARSLGVSDELRNDLDNTITTMQQPFDSSGNRLQAALVKDDARAKGHIVRNASAIQQNMKSAPLPPKDQSSGRA